MAIWISSNIDIGRSLNSRDGFPRWKFKNRAPTSCSAGPILWPPTISFELHAEMAEEIDLEKCTFRNFGRSVTLTLTLDRVEVTLVCICVRGLPTYQIRWKSEKLFVDVRTDRRTHLSSNLLGHRQGDDLKITIQLKLFSWWLCETWANFSHYFVVVIRTDLCINLFRNFTPYLHYIIILPCWVGCIWNYWQSAKAKPILFLQ